MAIKKRIGLAAAGLAAAAASTLFATGTAHADDCLFDNGAVVCGAITHYSDHPMMVAEYGAPGVRLPSGVSSRSYVNDVDQIWSERYYVRIQRGNTVTEVPPYYRMKISSNENLVCRQFDSTIVLCR